MAGFCLYAQDDIPAVKVTARATDRSIKLRWAVDSPAAWHFTNEYGYTIERIVITENNKVIKNGARVVLNQLPFKPASEARWEAVMDQDDYVAIAAQAIFGETFELTENYSSDIVTVINKARELEMRFSYALFAADQSIQAASLSGLYYEDEAIAPQVKYLYKVYANIPSHIMEVDTAFVYVGMQDYEPLPALRDVAVKFDDHLAMVSWNGVMYEKIYNSFWVERSDDGKTFEKITETPIVNTYNGAAPKTQTIYEIDSLPENNKTYYYRIIGINAFGELGPPSDTVSGFGIPIFAYGPSIIDHEITQKGQVKLNWKFPQEGNFLLKSFDLLRVNQATKAQEVLKTNLKPAVRQVIDSLPLGSNYYVVRANDLYGRQNLSFPYLVQLEDSIPPLPPIGLSGRIDTLGQVFLSWDNNAEPDLYGYQVYKSNFLSEQFIQLPGDIQNANSYIDSINLNTLTEKIYYKVVAIDKRFNTSDFSTILELKKPDFMPPVPPVLSQIKGDSLGIVLYWNSSSSEDVIHHAIYRKAENEQQWNLIKTISGSDTAQYFHDRQVEHRTLYQYTMVALDDDGLESIPASPLSMRWMSPRPYQPVSQLFYKLDKNAAKVSLSWAYEAGLVEKYLIYKSINGAPLMLFKTLEPTKKQLDDSFKASDKEIEYRIVAAFSTGERTELSKPLIVKF